MENRNGAWEQQRLARDAMTFDDAVDYMKAGEYKKALSVLEKNRALAVDAFPDRGSTPAIEVCIGECYENTGRPKEAREAYKKALLLVENFSPQKKAGFQHLLQRANDGLARIG